MALNKPTPSIKNIFCLAQVSFFVFWGTFFFGTFFAQAQSSKGPTVKTPHLTVSVISENQILAVGQNYFAFHFLIQPDWHIYWRNPGDSGAAPKFHLVKSEAKDSLNSKGSEIISVSWPHPSRIPMGSFFNFGYEAEVAFPFEYTLTQRDLDRGTLRRDYQVEWLVCKVECVPGKAELSLSLPVGPQSQVDLPSKTTIHKFLSQAPRPQDIFAEEALLSPQHLQVRSEILEKDLDWVTVFPHSSVFFQNQAPEVDWTKGGLEFLIPRTQKGPPTFPQTFLVVQGISNNEVRSYDLIVKSAKEISSLPNSGFGGKLSEKKSALEDGPVSGRFPALILLFVFAFMGGLILNFMPCVFPILSIKVFSLLKAQGNKNQLVIDSLTYFFGVIATFLLLGGVFLFLRYLGQNIGWGFQLQSPYFVYTMCILFFALALNFLGLFDLGESIMTWAGKKSHEKSSSFLTGALSVLVATPCTGPFMGSALGATVSLSAGEALGIFFFLGMGMGSPFLLLSFFPGWIGFLPKPGPWMVYLKEFFAFPLFATVLWLSWILIRQIGTGGMLPVGLAVLGMSFFIWAKSKTGSQALKRIFVLMALVSALGPLWMISSKAQSRSLPPVSSSAPSHLPFDEVVWHPYSESKLTELRAQGLPIFIDFTADWCITCQWNKKMVLDTKPVRELFKKNKVYLIRADWTNQDETITRALAEFGRASVPVYAFYAANSPASAEPRILPQLLTVDMIANLFKADE